MDQKSTTGTDKRSWRERLGIGAAGAAGKDMPRIADEFSPPAAAQPKPAVKPAPMAPRAPARAAARPAEPEKLADKLKAQRDAQEKLAEQRVQAARQRAEIPGAPASSAANGSSRPKFSFAGEEPEATPNTSAGLPLPPKPRSMAGPASPPPAAAKPVAPPAMTPQRPVAPPPSLSPAAMTPPRQPLGAEKPAFTQRPAAPPVQPQMARPPQQRFTPPPSAYPQATRPLPQQNYGSAVPPYRPVDPANRGGYAPGGYGAGLNGAANGYVPPAPPQTYGAGPRLNVPPLAPAAFGNDAYPPDGRARHLRPPARPGTTGYRDDYGAEGDIFEDRGQRRATAGDYRQAYRDMEQGYDEDLPPSRGPWAALLILLLLGVLVAAALWWLYQSNKPATNTAGGNAPVVEAPAQPVKVAPQPAAQPANTPSKKLIYDRIVGDKEVLGGEVVNTGETPQVPGDGAQPAGQPQGAAPAGQEELVPLPLPPPPGENGQQGSLDSPGNTPGDSPGKSDQFAINPAAGESQAAVPSQGAGGGMTTATTQSQDSTALKGDSPAIVGDNVVMPSKPQDAAPQQTAAAPPPPAAPDQGNESIVGTPDDTVVPETPKKPAKVAVADKPKVVKPKAEKNLGSKPVVLVPPSGKPAAVDATIDDGQVAVISQPPKQVSGGGAGGLYAGDGMVDPNQQAAANPAPAEPLKKKKTLADLFRNSDDTPDAPAAAQPAPQQVATAKPAPIQPAPAPAQPQATASGYVVQLSMFRTQGEANQEYARIKSRNGAAVAGLAPVITPADVSGSTRYRLGLGPVATREQASAVCTKLFANGERDCLVRRQ